MKYIIGEKDTIYKPKLKLEYIIDEYSFCSNFLIQDIGHILALNYLSIILDENGYVMDVGGFCSYHIWKKENIKVPDFKGGSLIVTEVPPEDDGHTTFIYRHQLPIYVNEHTGWVCIGDPEIQGNAVEFLRNCVAVISDKHEFLSLWLKAENFPEDFSKLTFSEVVPNENS